MNILQCKISKLYSDYPQIKSYFTQLAVPVISENMTLNQLFESISDLWMRDLGVTRESIIAVVQNIIEEKKTQIASLDVRNFSITIHGGKDKDGNPENLKLELKNGDVYGITGVTGSGKTRFLEDIEYLANGDSPTGRQILINEKKICESQRDYYENHLCASLSQSMNFVMELTCSDFIKLHAECRQENLSETEKNALVKKVIDCANSLAGERICESSMITQLSGGQSRSLMIADIAFVSDSPVVLIDEPENAGVDKNEILNLLSSKGKIVLVSTHDPVIALSCPKRIVIKNGAVSEIIQRTEEESKVLEELKASDERFKQIRNIIRDGQHVC